MVSGATSAKSLSSSANSSMKPRGTAANRRDLSSLMVLLYMCHSSTRASCSLVNIERSTLVAVVLIAGLLGGFVGAVNSTPAISLYLSGGTTKASRPCCPLPLLESMDRALAFICFCSRLMHLYVGISDGESGVNSL